MKISRQLPQEYYNNNNNSDNKILAMRAVKEN